MDTDRQVGTMIQIRISQLFLFSVLFLSTQCVPKPPVPENCDLTQGHYQVQTVGLQKTTGFYEVMVLNAPSCFTPPLVTAKIQLQRTKPEDREAAYLEVSDQGYQLFIAEDFQITSLENTQLAQQGSSTSSPFWNSLIGSSVGMVLGSMVSGALFNRGQKNAPHAPQAAPASPSHPSSTPPPPPGSYASKFKDQPQQPAPPHNKVAPPAPHQHPRLTARKRFGFFGRRR